MLTVVNSRKKSLVRLLLHNLDLLDHLGRNVLGSQLRVIQKECLTIDHDLGYRFSVCSYRSVRTDLDSRKFLEEFLKHIVVRCLE